MKDNLVQRQMTYLIQQLQKQQEPEGGMLFFKAVMQCRLDDTPESIERLDKMFVQMREQGITLEKIVQLPNHKIFLLTLGAYIGHYIGLQIGEVPAWFSFDNFKGFKDNSEVPAIFPFSIVAQFAYGISLPMGSVMEAIMGEDTIYNYIHNTVDEILSKSQVNLLLPASDICNEFLKKVRTGQLIDNKMAYRHLLKNIKFDYSYQSLIDIDKILQLIKTNERLTAKDYDTFVNDPSRQQFIYFIGCYILATSAFLAKCTPKWFNYEELKDIMANPEFTFCVETNQAVMFNGGYLRLPLMAVTNYFFDMNPNSSIGAVNFADNVLRDNADNLLSFRLSEDSNKPLPPHWKVVSSALPLLIQPNLQAISAGLPTTANSLYLEIENGDIRFIHTLPTFIDEQEMEKYMSMPHGNPYYNFLCYEGYVNLPTGRTDALVMEARVFAEPKLHLKLMLPYRPDTHPFGLAFYPVVTNQLEGCDEEDLKAMAHIFYQTISQEILKSHGRKLIDFYIDKHDLFAPAPWVNQPITSFNPTDSQIEIFPLPA